MWRVEKLKVGDTFMRMNEHLEEKEVQVLSIMTYENKEYMVMVYVEDIEYYDELEAIDLMFVMINEEGEFEKIREEEFEKVATEFQKIFYKDDTLLN